MKKSNWFLLVVNGLIAILFGLLALFLPKETIISLVLYFGLVVLAGGLIMLVIALRNMKQEKSSALLLAEAIGAVLIGAIIAFWPKNSLQIFLIMVGIWAAIVGLMQIILAVQMKNKISNHSMFTINGIITLVFGLLLFYDPLGAITVLFKIIGVLSLASGILLIYLGIRVKGISQG